MSSLNERAWELCNAMAADADSLGIAVNTLDCGTRLIDCGVKVAGSIEVGRRLAEICLAGLGEVIIFNGNPDSPVWSGPSVGVVTKHPVAACMASQYAGWEINDDGYFAMGSGPMRAAAGREKLFDEIGHREERPEVCVGVLETSKLPPDGVCTNIAEKCGIAPNWLTLVAARTASAAGTVQIAARSVETAMHKLHTLGFELSRIERAWGRAPIPPIAADDLTAIGWTNDAILYGGKAHLRIAGDDESLQAIGPRVPSSASLDFGQPFSRIFARYKNDFYRIDPMLFSPAVVTLANFAGKEFEFGQFAPEVLAQSFAKK
jgi:methenyltetrahydromethanopterin cyclohydrolase